jgi:hypothetical protein
MPPKPLEPGDPLRLGRFELLGRLGEGGQGIVYLGRINTLTLSQVTATVLTFSEPQTVSCVAGTVTFTRRGANLAYRWTGGGEQNVATLRKT